jgi:aspartate racemase
MKTVGMVGGLGPESTVDYYQRIVARYTERVQDGSYPRILINSVDLKPLVDLFNADDLAGATDYLVTSVELLARAGADFGLISANTPHVVFDEVNRRSPIKLISIVEAACEAAKASGRKRLGLFGTRFTMHGHFYQDVFARSGIALVVPEASEQSWIHDRYMGELLKGVFRPETHAGLLDIVQHLQAREGIDGLLLAGTELPLILREESHRGLPILDTARIHVERVVDELLRPEGTR